MKTLHYSTWVDEVRAKFPVAEEFALAWAIYEFEMDYDNNLTPQESYDKFDQFVCADA